MQSIQGGKFKSFLKKKKIAALKQAFGFCPTLLVLLVVAGSFEIPQECHFVLRLEWVCSRFPEYYLAEAV